MRAMPTIVWLSLSMIVVCLTGCLSPHGGFRLPFAGEPKPRVYGGDGLTYETAFSVRHISEDNLDDLENGALYDHVYHVIHYGKHEYIPIDSRPTEADFKRGIERTKQRVGRKVYHEVTFTAANGERERRYFDITDIVHH